MVVKFSCQQYEYEKRVASIVEQSWLIFSEESEGKEEGGKGEATEWGSGAIHAEGVRDVHKKSQEI